MKCLTLISLIAIIIVIILLCKGSKEGFSPDFGYWRYGYPYTNFGTFYRTQGYWGPSYQSSPYSSSYGGKDQMSSCEKGCLDYYGDERSTLKRCLYLCQAHSPFYNFDESY